MGPYLAPRTSMALLLLVAKTTLEIAKEGERDPRAPKRADDPLVSRRAETQRPLIAFLPWWTNGRRS
jgi:hypothetical protein